MKKVIFCILFLLLFIFQVSGETIDDTLLRSEGINANITVDFPLTFTQLVVTPFSIEFTDLSFNHPNSCANASSSFALYNYTTANSAVTTTELFGSISCTKDVNDQVGGLLTFIVLLLAVVAAVKGGYELFKKEDK